MPSLFFTLNIARRGLSAQQAGMHTTSHNIANANTPGFSRQRAVLETTTPWPVPSVNMPAGAGQIGTGVEVSLIERIRDTFLDRQIRNELATLGLWEQRRDALEQVEVVFMEPGETGLATLLGQFWDSWQELSKYPESMPVRTTVTETAQALAEALRHTYRQLETIRSDLNALIGLKVEEVNTLARQIADLNKQIVTIKAAGMSPNDLLDRRDLLLDELSKILEITVVSADSGAVKVGLAGKENAVMVDGDQVSPLQALADPTSGDYAVGFGAETLSGGQLGGELEGLFYARDDLLRDTYLKQLDQFARALAQKVNSQHAAGRGLDGVAGRVFFVKDEAGTDQNDLNQVTTAKNIYVNPELVENVARLAAAAEGEGEPAPGDGTNALAIARLRREPITDLGGFTFDDYYKNFIARLGVHTHEAQRMVENQNVLVEQLNKRKESISGVSLDEEMVNLIQYQYAYQAAARVITVVDEMLDTLINRMAP